MIETYLHRFSDLRTDRGRRYSAFRKKEILSLIVGNGCVTYIIV